MTSDREVAGAVQRPADDDRVLRPNRPTPQGRELGQNMARLYGPAIQELAAQGEPDERCATCALRAGSLPNGCETTLMDLLKCGLEGDVAFYCHDSRRKGQTCHGWFAIRYAHNGKKLSVPWKFADEYAPIQAPSAASGNDPERAAK